MMIPTTALFALASISSLAKGFNGGIQLRKVALSCGISSQTHLVQSGSKWLDVGSRSGATTAYAYSFGEASAVVLE